MSTDYTTFVGPHIKIHNPPVEGKKEYYTCVTLGCKQQFKQISSKFCAECGRPIQLHSFPDHKPKKFDFYGETDGALYGVIRGEYIPKDSPDKHCEFVISNKLNALTFDPKTGDYFKAFDANYITESTKAFEEFHKEHIAKLKAFFGEHAVTVQFGVLGWVS